MVSADCRQPCDGLRAAGATLGGAQAKTCAAQAAEQLSTRRQRRACADQVVEVLLGHVVVIALKPAARYPGPFRKRMQLVVAHVTDQMRPSPALEPPDRLVDQHCHGRHCAVTSPR